MKKLLNAVSTSIRSFAKEEDGAQIIEYALIVAVVSIALIVAIDPIKTGFGGWVTKVQNCLTNGTCTVAPAP